MKCQLPTLAQQRLSNCLMLLDALRQLFFPASMKGTSLDVEADGTYTAGVLDAAHCQLVVWRAVPASIHKQAISGNKTLMVKVPGQFCSYCILVQNINIFLYSHALFAVYYIFNSLITLQIFIFDKLYIVSYPNIMGMGTGRDHPKGAFQKNLSRSFSPKACKQR